MPNPSYKLSEIADKLGVKLSLKDPEDDIVITGINTLEEAGQPQVRFTVVHHQGGGRHRAAGT